MPCPTSSPTSLCPCSAWWIWPLWGICRVRTSAPSPSAPPSSTSSIGISASCAWAPAASRHRLSAPTAGTKLSKSSSAPAPSPLPSPFCSSCCNGLSQGWPWLSSRAARKYCVWPLSTFSSASGRHRPLWGFTPSRGGSSACRTPRHPCGLPFSSTASTSPHRCFSCSCCIGTLLAWPSAPSSPTTRALPSLSSSCVASSTATNTF